MTQDWIIFTNSIIRRIIFSITCLILLVGCSLAPGPENFDGERAYKFAVEQVEFGPRIPGSAAHSATGDWILTQLETYGWVTEEQYFEYEGTTIRNIIAYYGDKSQPAVLFGAHYDTRPFADRDEFYPNQPVPGANDGASGTAVLLELARVVTLNNYSNPIQMVFFDAEDSGEIADWDWIVGSSYFAQHLEIEPEAVIIVDMVGDAELELYLERNSDDQLKNDIWKTAAEIGIDAFIPEEKYGIIDDHTPFLVRGIPAVDIIDFDYPYWHTIEDTLDKISAESLEAVGLVLQAWLSERESH